MREEVRLGGQEGALGNVGVDVVEDGARVGWAGGEPCGRSGGVGIICAPSVYTFHSRIRRLFSRVHPLCPIHFFKIWYAQVLACLQRVPASAETKRSLQIFVSAGEDLVTTVRIRRRRREREAAERLQAEQQGIEMEREYRAQNPRSRWVGTLPAMHERINIQVFGSRLTFSLPSRVDFGVGAVSSFL